MTAPEDKYVGFLKALIGIVFDPSNTIKALINNQGSPYGVRLLLCLFISVFVPIVAQLVKYNHNMYDARGVTSLFMIVIFWVLIFTVLEHVFLRLIGIKALPSAVFASTAYTLTPFMWFIWFIYAFNYYTSGNLVIADVLISGEGTASKLFLRIAPVLFFLAIAMVFFILSVSLRVLGELTYSGGLTSAFMSLLPLGISLFVATAIVENGRPGTVDYFKSYFNNPRLVKPLG